MSDSLQAVHDVALGKKTEETVKFLNSRQLDNPSNTFGTHLFARRVQVQKFNAEELMKVRITLRYF